MSDGCGRRIVDIKHPGTRVTYSLEEIGRPKLDDVLGAFMAQMEDQED